MDVGVRLALNESADDVAWCDDLPDLDVDIGQLLIAVILSAQTTDDGVNKVTPDLFKQYPTPKAMAKASQEDIEALVRSTGFFRNKAKSNCWPAERIWSG